LPGRACLPNWVLSAVVVVGRDDAMSAKGCDRNKKPPEGGF
jgi:hypothetical protein